MTNLLLTCFYLLPYAWYVAGKIQRPGLEARLQRRMTANGGIFICASVILWQSFFMGGRMWGAYARRFLCTGLPTCIRAAHPSSFRGWRNLKPQMKKK